MTNVQNSAKSCLEDSLFLENLRRRRFVLGPLELRDCNVAPGSSPLTAALVGAMFHALGASVCTAAKISSVGTPIHGN